MAGQRPLAGGRLVTESGFLAGPRGDRAAGRGAGAGACPVPCSGARGAVGGKIADCTAGTGTGNGTGTGTCTTAGGAITTGPGKKPRFRDQPPPCQRPLSRHPLSLRHSPP